MSITVNFYQFDKKLNSTALPTNNTTSKTLSCQLKDNTNLLAPRLTVNTSNFSSQGSITNPLIWDYCYISDFSRYYFVRQWSWVSGIWECELEVDVLGSFKTEIGNTTAYILRSRSDYNPDIIDNKYPTMANDPTGTANWARAYSHLDDPWDTNLTSSGTGVNAGFYRIGIANDDSAAIGSISYYAFSPAAARNLFDMLYRSPDWMDITDTSISEDLQKMMFNPIQYITDIIWIPIGLNTSGLVSTTSLSYGWWTLSLNYPVYKINSTKAMIGKVSQITIPRHPGAVANDKLKWLNLSPYTQYSLEYQPFGVFELSSAQIYGATQLKMTVEVDLITGRGILSVATMYGTGNNLYSDDIPIYVTAAQVGIPIPVAQMSVDTSALSSVSTYAGAAAIAGLTGDLGEHISQFGSALGNFVQSIPDQLAGRPTLRDALGDAVNRIQAATGGEVTPVGSTGSALLSTMKTIAADILPAAIAAAGVCTMNGVSGGVGMLRRSVKMTAFYQYITPIDYQHYGYPLCKKKKINTLSGFTLCANEGDLTIPATPAERIAVSSFMTGGFYYE